MFLGKTPKNLLYSTETAESIGITGLAHFVRQKYSRIIFRDEQKTKSVLPAADVLDSRRLFGRKSSIGMEINMCFI